MKKRNSSRQNPKAVVKAKRAKQSVTIGMDLGDETSRYCVERWLRCQLGVLNGKRLLPSRSRTEYHCLQRCRS